MATWIEIERDEEAIADLVERAAERSHQPSHFPGMTYEEGVRAAMDWLTDPDEEDPLPEVGS